MTDTIAEELAKARQAAKAAKMMGRFEDSQDNQEEEYATERMKEINPDDERKFPCTLCDFKFKRRDHLNRHMTVHTDQIIMPSKLKYRHVYFFFFFFCGDRNCCDGVTFPVWKLNFF